MNKILIAFLLLLNVCHAQDLMVQTSPLVEEEPQASPPYQLEGQILNMEISPLGEDVELTERAYDLAMPVYVTPNWDLVYDKKVSRQVTIQNLSSQNAPGVPLALELYNGSQYAGSITWNLNPIPARSSVQYTLSITLKYGTLPYLSRWTTYYALNPKNCSSSETNCKNNVRGPGLLTVSTDQNLKISNVRVPLKAKAYETLPIDIVLTNTRPSSTQPGEVTLELTRHLPFQQISGTFKVPSLAFGKNYVLAIDVNQDFMKPSSYTVVAWAHPGVTGDPYEGPYQVYTTASVENISDLVAWDLIFPSVVKEDQPFEALVQIKVLKFMKTRPAGPIVQEIRLKNAAGSSSILGGFSLSPAELSQTGGGQILQKTVSLQGLKAGKHQILFEIDKNQVIGFPHTANNLLEKSLTVEGEKLWNYGLKNLVLYQNGGFISDTIHPDSDLEVHFQLFKQVYQPTKVDQGPAYLTVFWQEDGKSITKIGEKTLSGSEISEGDQDVFIEILKSAIQDLEAGPGVIRVELFPPGGDANPTDHRLQKQARISPKQFYVQGTSACSTQSKDNLQFAMDGPYPAELLECTLKLLDEDGEPAPKGTEVIVYEKFDHLALDREKDEDLKKWQRRYYFHSHEKPWELKSLSPEQEEKDFREEIYRLKTGDNGEFTIQLKSKSWYVAKYQENYKNEDKYDINSRSSFPPIEEIKKEGWGFHSGLSTEDEDRPFDGRIVFNHKIHKIENPENYMEVHQWGVIEEDTKYPVWGKDYLTQILKDIFDHHNAYVQYTLEKIHIAGLFPDAESPKRWVFIFFDQIPSSEVTFGRTGISPKKVWNWMLLNPYYRRARLNLPFSTKIDIPSEEYSRGLSGKDLLFKSENILQDTVLHELRHVYQSYIGYNLKKNGRFCSEDNDLFVSDKNPGCLYENTPTSKDYPEIDNSHFQDPSFFPLDGFLIDSKWNLSGEKGGDAINDAIVNKWYAFYIELDAFFFQMKYR